MRDRDSQPALQNIPIRSDLGRQLRLVLTGQRPGLVLPAAEYATLELRLMAMLIHR